jgi:membrane-associated phospholipid phosphatase
MMRTLVFLGILATASSAAAQEDEHPAVRWNEEEWGRVQSWEYGATAVLMGGAFFARFGIEHGPANWEGGILFDDAVIESLAVRGEPERANLFLATDISFFGSMAFRLVDSLLVPGVGYGDWDLGLQMSMIDLEAFAVVAAVLWGSQLGVRRARPYVSTCNEDPAFRERNLDDDCDPQSGDTARSFIAGHTAVAIAAAGLTCMHHAHVPTYGGVGDDLACGVMIAQAAFNGVGRVLTEKHYASDLAFAIVLGTAAGWLVPALHYDLGLGRPSITRSSRARQGPRVMLVPNVTDTDLGASAIGLF